MPIKHVLVEHGSHGPGRRPDCILHVWARALGGLWRSIEASFGLCLEQAHLDCSRKSGLRWLRGEGDPAPKLSKWLLVVKERLEPVQDLQCRQPEGAGVHQPREELRIS